jgi:peptidoglycan hydrolase CwlO-like protein
MEVKIDLTRLTFSTQQIIIKDLLSSIKWMEISDKMKDQNISVLKRENSESQSEIDQLKKSIKELSDELEQLKEYLPKYVKG